MYLHTHGLFITILNSVTLKVTYEPKDPFSTTSNIWRSLTKVIIKLVVVILMVATNNIIRHLDLMQVIESYITLNSYLKLQGFNST